MEGDWLLPMIRVFEEKENVGASEMFKDWHFQTDLIRGVVFGPLGNPRHYGQWFKDRKFRGEVNKWRQLRQLVA